MRCPNCAEEARDAAKVCGHCGTPLNACPECSHANDPAYGFCEECGAVLGAGASDPVLVACGSCGTENDAGLNFCEECGHELAATGTASGGSRRRWLLIAALIGGVLMVGAGVALAIIAPWSGSTDPIALSTSSTLTTPGTEAPETRATAQSGLLAVPNVVGSSEDFARARMESAGLTFVGASSAVVCGSSTDGTVIRQDPAAGTPVASGSTVRGFIGRAECAGGADDPPADDPPPAEGQGGADDGGQAAPPAQGPATVAVPDVNGMTEEQARQALTGAGFTPVMQYVDADECGLTAEGDRVSSHTPVGATTAGAAVTVTVTREVECPETGPPMNVGDDPEYDAKYWACDAGDLAACDWLVQNSHGMSDYYALGNTCAGLTPLASWGFWCVDLEYVPNIVGQILYLWAPNPYLDGAPFTAVYAGQDPSICVPANTWTESTQQVTAQHPGGGMLAPPGTDLQYWVADLLPWGTPGC